MRFDGLIGKGGSFVSNLPPAFSLKRACSKATRISLAAAFAKQSGWSLIGPCLEQSGAELRLIAGLDFCLTEPKLLESWNHLQSTREDVTAFLSDSSQAVFHPKVLLVESPTKGFGIIGSGNLSHGGLQSNYECSVYITDPKVLSEINSWFCYICSEPAGAVQLSAAHIDAYRAKYKKAAAALATVRKQQKTIEREIRREHLASMDRWQAAVRVARKYFSSQRFKNDWREWELGIRSIRSVIKAPEFHYSQRQWQEFFEIWTLGHLIPIYRDVAFREVTKTQQGLRALANAEDARGPLSELLNPGGRYHVPSVGLNVISKILAVNYPKTWPVYNGPVAAVLQEFRYKAPRGASRGEKYLAFAKLMRRFVKETGAKNMLQLDPFFYYYDQREL